MVVNFLLMLVLFYLVLNTLLYDWTGRLYQNGMGYRLDTLLDNAIPFVPEWMIFYYYIFYPLAIATMVFFGFFDARKGYALGWSLVLINAIAIVVYIVFPVSTYWWRLDIQAQNFTGFWAEQVYTVYRDDTSFNCFPSLHAAVSTICFYAWYRYAKLKPGTITKLLAVVTFISATGVILSTLFVKQHYIADEIAGIFLAWVVGRLLFNKLWKRFDVKTNP